MNPYGSFGAHTYWRLVLDSNNSVFTFRLYDTEEATEPALHEKVTYTLTAISGTLSSWNNVLPTDRAGRESSWNPSAGSDRWIKFEFDEPVEVKSAWINCYSSSLPWKIQYSDNDSDWYTAAYIPASVTRVYAWQDAFGMVKMPYILGGQYAPCFMESRQDRPKVGTITTALDTSWDKEVQTVQVVLDTSYDRPITPMDAGDFGMMVWHYSGGAANTDEAAALGGQLSNTPVPYQNVYTPDPVSGITVERIVSSSVSWGVVSFESMATGYFFSWVPSGAGTESGVIVYRNGKVTILAGGELAEGYIQLDIDMTLLPDSGELSVFVQNVPGNVFTGIEAAEAESGSTVYRGLYIWNTHATKTYRNLALYVRQQFIDSQIGLEIAVESAPLQTIATETDAPVGPTFSVPTEASPLIIGNITPGSIVGVWFKRTVVSNCTLDSYAMVAKVGLEGRYI